jgi:hypothetical protein
MDYPFCAGGEVTAGAGSCPVRFASVGSAVSPLLGELVGAETTVGRDGNLSLVSIRIGWHGLDQSGAFADPELGLHIRSGSFLAGKMNNQRANATNGDVLLKRRSVCVCRDTRIDRAAYLRASTGQLQPRGTFACEIGWGTRIFVYAGHDSLEEEKVDLREQLDRNQQKRPGRWPGRSVTDDATQV